LTLAILRRFSLSTRFGIGFAKSERSRKEMNVMKTATSFLAASGCKSAAYSETGQRDKPAFNVVNYIKRGRRGQIAPMKLAT